LNSSVSRILVAPLRRKRFAVLGLLILSAVLGPRAGAAPAPTEFEIKAVFLYHFTQFVEWPEAAFSGPHAPFVIGLVGADPFGPSLRKIIGGEAVGTHPLQLQEVSDVSAELRCQILYFSEKSEDTLDLQRLRTAPVLTVGESDTFCKRGGMIQFFIDRRRVRLKVNLEEARAHSLEISAKLLRVAEVTQWGRIQVGVYASGGRTELVPKGDLREYGPADLLALRPRDPVLQMGVVQQILAHD
jgi:YfiR/HmsC-like